jgi:hypothetical protein
MEIFLATLRRQNFHSEKLSPHLPQHRLRFLFGFPGEGAIAFEAKLERIGRLV